MFNMNHQAYAILPKGLVHSDSEGQTDQRQCAVKFCLVR